MKILLLILLCAISYDLRCGVLLPPVPSTNLDKHAAPHQEGPHTRGPASPEKPEVHPEQELHRAEQHNNMD